MKLEKVYNNDGELLGDQYTNLSHLQKDTRLAIIQIIHLDEAVNILKGYALPDAEPNTKAEKTGRWK